jgi:5-formyltetrahydrofolate cyclo-ligase
MVQLRTLDMTKPELRRTFLQARRALPMADWRARSNRLVQHLRTAPLFIQASTVFAYFSIHQEPDLRSLWNLNDGHPDKIWGFPRCVGKTLVWHRWQPSDPLSVGAYGIPEPDATLPILTQADLILVPAVACDRRGYRLGYGGGFYDRLLSDPVWAGTPAIGITFAFAHPEQLPHDSWDQPLHAVCTENGLDI